MKRTINTIAELVYRQHNPNPQEPVSGEYIESAKIHYAARMWYSMQEQKAALGEWDIPSQMLVRGMVKVTNNKADISSIQAMKSLPGDMWLQGIGDDGCYGKLTHNDSLMVDEETYGSLIPYRVVGNNIEFLKDVDNDKELSILYVSSGTGISGDVEVDDVIAQWVMNKLDEQYGKKQPEDKTNNNNSNS